jgi:hypothetical protein
MIGVLAAATLAAAQPAAAPALPANVPQRVIFARAMLDGWRLEAITDVATVAGLPMIDSSFCEMKRSGLALTTWADGGLAIDFGDHSVDPELGFEKRQIRRIAIDEAVWDFRQREGEGNRYRFVDVTYRPLPPCYGCIEARSYTRGLRRRAGDPWLPPDVVSNVLARGRMLRIGFQQEDDDERLVPPMLWAEVPLTGLDRAIAWCRTALASDAARRLRGGLDDR